MSENGMAYSVTYIEASPEHVEDVVQCIRDILYATMSVRGHRESYALQRIGQAHHFVVASAWDGLSAWEKYLTQRETLSLDGRMAEWLLAPLDRRVHHALSVGDGWDTASSGFYAVTHVDVIPPAKEEGTALIKSIADACRAKGGNIRFDALTQEDRPNHMTVIEAWAGADAQVGHMTAPHTKAYRDALAPLCGALYDERIYMRVPG